ncbi:FAD-dependent thymidylate synthase [Candidatus Microgenomates bacterium]|nr:FAD-dependent thymidylate synthase [Candidatus Microgenomates bacterium]
MARVDVEHETYETTPGIEIDFDAIRYLNECLAFKDKFENPPFVELSLVTRVPYGHEEMGVVDIASTVATQCYSPRRAVFRPRQEQKSHKLARRILLGGHHTTRQHFQVTYAVDNVTRAAVHDTFHFPKYYNSDQQSQRYASIEVGGFQIPTNLTAEQKALYMDCGMYANTAFTRLNELLAPLVNSKLRQIWPNKPSIADKVEKLVQENGRYVLPIAQFSTFDYSINELQLLRLFRTSKLYGTSDESRYILARMVQDLISFDPTFIEELSKPLEKNVGAYGPGITPNYCVLDERFDKNLNGKNTWMEPVSIRDRLIRITRQYLGFDETQKTDTEILKMILDPKLNTLLADVYEPAINDPASSVLRLVSVAYDTKLAYIIDAQRERHRETPGSAPMLERIYSGKADYMTPPIVMEHPQAKEFYDKTMAELFTKVNRCLDAGIPKELVVRLLPNAYTLRLSENGDLLNWIHRFKQRACFRAQQEIGYVTYDQMTMLLEDLPEAEQVLQAPCGIRKRASITPFCPEGDGYCGIPVYRHNLPAYENLRII